MMTKKDKTRLLTYAISHAAVDMCCAFLIFSRLYGGVNTAEVFLVYNFCAFALQLPLGAAADAADRNGLFAASGCALLAASFALTSAPLVCAAAAGTGNALFHIGGGVDIMNLSRGKCAPLGYFVAPGAAGLYLGALAGKGGWQVLPFALIPLACGAAILLFCRVQDMKFKSGNAPFSVRPDKNAFGALALLALFLVAGLRSYMGMSFDFSWKALPLLGIIFVAAVVIGKAAGGFLFDNIGALETVAFSLCICTLIFYFSDIPILGVLSVLLFNMTMPITLWGVMRMFPGAKGFAFGLLTFALFLGFLPYGLGVGSFTESRLWYCGVSLASFVLMLAGLGKALKRGVK